MQFKNSLMAMASLAILAHGAAVPEASTITPRTDGDFSVTTYSGGHCNRDNQGTTNVHKDTRACIQWSKAGSFEITNDSSCGNIEAVYFHGAHCGQDGGKKYTTKNFHNNGCFGLGDGDHGSAYFHCAG